MSNEERHDCNLTSALGRDAATVPPDGPARELPRGKGAAGNDSFNVTVDTGRNGGCKEGSTVKPTIIKEGRGRYLAFITTGTNNSRRSSWKEKNVPTKSMPVFYNPAMKLNRDISILATGAWLEGKRRQVQLGDIFCGNGIRGIRAIVDLPDASINVDFVDLNPRAIDLCKQNLALNGVDPGRWTTHVAEANAFLHARALHDQDRHDIIHVDPFGNPVTYMAGALRATKKSGALIHVNATDLAVISGVHLKATRRKYGATPLRHVSFHGEQSVRVLLGSLARKAMENDCMITPLMSVVKRHYVKVIVEKKHGAMRSNKLLDDIGYLVHCFSCHETWTIPVDEHHVERNCPTCNEPRVKIGGPLWIGPIQDADFCQRVEEFLARNDDLGYGARLPELVRRCKEEASFAPGSIDIHELGKELVVKVPSMNMILEELENRGFNGARSQSNPTAIKTNARVSDVKEIIIHLQGKAGSGAAGNNSPGEKGVAGIKPRREDGSP